MATTAAPLAYDLYRPFDRAGCFGSGPWYFRHSHTSEFHEDEIGIV